MVVVIRKDATPAEREAIARTLLAGGLACCLSQQESVAEGAQLQSGRRRALRRDAPRVERAARRGAARRDAVPARQPRLAPRQDNDPDPAT